MSAELLAPIVNFAVVIVVLFKVGKKPMSEFLVTRSRTIAEQIAEGQKLSADAEKQLALWEANWKSSEAHSKQSLEDAKASIARFRETTLTSARTEAERVRQDAKLVAQSESTRAKQGIGRELAEKSVQLAAQYLRSHMEDGDRHKLVSEYVEKLAHA